MPTSLLGTVVFVLAEGGIFQHWLATDHISLRNSWAKKQVTKSGEASVQRFAKGIERDKEAVLAGLTLTYSNGMTEGGCRTSSS